MDGLKRRLKALLASRYLKTSQAGPTRAPGSIQARLSIVLTAVVLLMAAVAGTFSFLTALREAHKLQDSILYQIAGVMQERAPKEVKILRLRDRDDDDSRVLVWPLRPDAPPLEVRTKHQTLTLPNDLEKGRHTLTLAGESYRVVTRKGDSGRRLAVAQETHFRDLIALNSALRTVAPFLVLVPILLITLVLLIRRMFRPIAHLSAEIDQRDDQDLRPIDDGHIPSEVRPFLRAINRLLARVAQSMEAQRRFVADAAHELRSPMTALSLQAERLAQADMSATAQGRLSELRSGIERVRKLLNQLLALARVQAAAADDETGISLRQTFRQILEELMPLAQAREIDIGLEGSADAMILASPLDLTTLVKNLVDNAIRYTPEHGRVDLSVEREADRVMLRVADSGPGIPAADRERVFDPFYRVLGSGQTGSGLGLAIVRTIAKRLEATITLDETDTQTHRGLCVTVHFPAHRVEE